MIPRKELRYKVIQNLKKPTINTYFSFFDNFESPKENKSNEKSVSENEPKNDQTNRHKQ